MTQKQIIEYYNENCGTILALTLNKKKSCNNERTKKTHGSSRKDGQY